LALRRGPGNNNAEDLLTLETLKHNFNHYIGTFTELYRLQNIPLIAVSFSLGVRNFFLLRGRISVAQSHRRTEKNKPLNSYQ
jgi:hypothetical protein